MNYIFFQTAADNSALYPVDAIRGIKQIGNLQLKLFLNPLKPNEVLTSKDVDAIIINVLDDTSVKERFKELVAFVNQPASAREDGFLILGNDLTGESFTTTDKFNNLGSYTLAAGS